VTPFPKKNCTFSFRGNGGFPIGVRASIPRRGSNKLDPAWVHSIVITLAPNLTQLQFHRDTLIAWSCAGSKVVTAKVIPLFTGWYSDRLGTEWRITDWQYLQGALPTLAQGEWHGTCALSTCIESDIFDLSEVQP
jgi:hypothetical protein